MATSRAASIGASAGCFNGPTATGQQCPEGWTLYPIEASVVPRFAGTTIGTDRPYLLNVDEFNTLGLGKDVPVTYPDNADAIIAWLPDKKQWVTLRLPYPMGAMFTKQVIGRIEDPEGRLEGSRPLVEHRDVRAVAHRRRQGHARQGHQVSGAPDPLAK